jgi:glycine cleavage system H protein
MKLDQEARYAATHEWIRLEGADAVTGISDHAQRALGDIVFVELPAAGKAFRKGESMCVVESVKAASDVYAPLSGKVVESNPALAAEPGLVNSDCYGSGWLVKLRPDDPAEAAGLMDAAAYAAGLGGEP